jgi:hypothetical protein
MRLWIALVSILLVLLAACTSDDPTSAPAPTATNVSAPPTTVPTVTARPDTSAAKRAQTAAVVSAFGEAFVAAESSWDAFSAEFDTWQQGFTGCGTTDRSSDLAAWVVDFRVVVTAVTSVAFPVGTDAVRTSISNALSGEEAGLQTQRDTWRPGSNAAIAGYETARTSASLLRQTARVALIALMAQEAADAAITPDPEATPDPDAPAVATGEELLQLQEDIATAEAAWDAFHTRYDAWRATDGSCNQGSVRSKLGGLNSDFNAVLDAVSDISRPSVVRPLAEQLIDAAVAQSQAIQALLDGWVPYDAAPWDAYAATSDRAASLRRQVRSSLDELELDFQTVPAG